jgi:hypothetical protein
MKESVAEGSAASPKTRRPIRTTLACFSKYQAVRAGVLLKVSVIKAAPSPATPAAGSDSSRPRRRNEAGVPRRQTRS